MPLRSAQTVPTPDENGSRRVPPPSDKSSETPDLFRPGKTSTLGRPQEDPTGSPREESGKKGALDDLGPDDARRHPGRPDRVQSPLWGGSTGPCVVGRGWEIRVSIRG